MNGWMGAVTLIYARPAKKAFINHSDSNPPSSNKSLEKTRENMRSRHNSGGCYSYRIHHIYQKASELEFYIEFILNLY